MAVLARDLGIRFLSTTSYIFRRRPMHGTRVKFVTKDHLLTFLEIITFNFIVWLEVLKRLILKTVRFLWHFLGNIFNQRKFYKISNNGKLLQEHKGKKSINLDEF